MFVLGLRVNFKSCLRGVKEMTGGHDCLCAVCSPSYRKQLEDRITRRIYRDKSVELGEQTKQRILAEMTAERHKELAGKLKALRATVYNEHK